MESRLAEIEVKLSFSEDLLEELNQTVIRQQQQIDRLQQELLVLRQQVQAGNATDSFGPHDETPPHY
jgi:SlyX protein